MYEDLTFIELTSATRHVESSNTVETLDDASIEHEESRTANKLHINNIGEGQFNSVFVDLVDGELQSSNEKLSNPDFQIDESNVEVDNDEMAITIDRPGETISLTVECEGEVTDDTGADLEKFGVDI